MSSHHESETVRTMLRQVDQGRRPTTAERENIADHMWRAFAQQPLEREHSPSIIVEDSDDQTGQHTRRGRSARLLVAAAVLLLLAIPIGMGLFSVGSEPIEVAQVGIEPEMRFTATVGGVQLGFATQQPAAIGRSGDDFLMVQALNAKSPFGATADSLSGNVVIARPSRLFDGQDPDEWFAAQGLQAEAVPATFEGRQIPAWNVIIPSGLLAAADCELRRPCLGFAQMDSGLTLSFEKGFEINRIRLIPVEDGDQPLLMFSLFDGPRQGPSDNVVAKLSGEILATLRLGNCPFTC